MTETQILWNKRCFEATARQFIHREGLIELLEHLATKTDFYTAPSSANFHLNETGGLCKHSLNVFLTAMKITGHIVGPYIQEGISPFATPISEESVAIVSLFHDICKTNIYHATERYRKDDTGRWVAYQGYRIEDDFPLGHGEKSCYLLHSFMKLTKGEALAIRWHMGMFDMAEAGSAQRKSYYAAMEQSPLVAILQAADLLSANCLEKTIHY